MHALILSPHRDDAAFSCGLLLHHVLAMEVCSVTIANVCTVSGYAPYEIQQDRNETARVTAIRQKEDEVFAQRLHAASGAASSQLQWIDLRWHDLPLRWHTEDTQALAASDLRIEEVTALQTTLSMLPPADVVLAPMALGGHIDHRLVHQAALLAFAADSLVHYEDLPYACRMSSAERAAALDNDAQADEAWLPVDARPSTLKRDFACCYPSQIAADVADEMQHYAVDHGCRERFLGSRKAMQKLRSLLEARGVTRA